jgi:hypothetical protein
LVPIIVAESLPGERHANKIQSVQNHVELKIPSEKLAIKKRAMDCFIL